MSPESHDYFDSPAHRWAYNGAAVGLILLAFSNPWPFASWRGQSFLLVLAITYVLAWSAGRRTGAHETVSPPEDHERA